MHPTGDDPGQSEPLSPSNLIDWAQELEKENAELRQQLAAFHAAMEREKKPDWEKWLKDLADDLTRDIANTPPALSTLEEAARQLRYMADSFTLKANFVPSELKIKELEQQLARAQATCAELRKALSLCSTLGDDGSAFRTFGLADRGYRLVEVRKLAETAIQSSDCGKGWRSPQDWERLAADLETANLCIKGLEGNLAAAEKELERCVTALNKIRHELKARFPDDFPLNQNLRDIVAIADDALKGDK